MSPSMKKLMGVLEHWRVMEVNSPKLVSSMCFSIFWSSDGATAQRPSVPVPGGRLPAMVSPSENEIEQAVTPGRQLARSTNSLALLFASADGATAEASAAAGFFSSVAGGVDAGSSLPSSEFGDVG